MHYYLLLVALVFITGCQATRNQPSAAAINSKTNESSAETITVEVMNAEPATKIITSAEIPGIPSEYRFSAEIPAHWEVEYIQSSEAISVFDPTSDSSPAATPLEQSQIFIRYFSANTFLTLSTVTIHAQTETEINSRPAVVYDIEKKSGVPNFPSQPTWRNERHFVTDIRSTDTNPAVYYVFAKRPELPQATFDAFLQSVTFE